GRPPRRSSRLRAKPGRTRRPRQASDRRARLLPGAIDAAASCDELRSGFAARQLDQARSGGGACVLRKAIDSKEAPLAGNPPERGDTAIPELNPRPGDQIPDGARNQALARTRLGCDSGPRTHSDSPDL